jgi:ribonuclease D
LFEISAGKKMAISKRVVGGKERLVAVLHETVTTPEQLEKLADQLRQEPWFAFDTEFVGGPNYSPRLCLIQIFTRNMEVLVDAQTVSNLSPFWEVVCEASPEKIVHGGRVEAEFCFQAVGKLPAGWFDVQLAAGFVAEEYPAGYAKLVEKFLGVTLGKAETRTDWRRRPLSPEQIEYALADVRYLPALREKLESALAHHGRWGWFQEETQRQLTEIKERLTESCWWKIAGARNLDRRRLAILRSLWTWRDQLARAQNRSPRSILRDDLLLELARRATADPKQIAAVHGFEQPRLQRMIPSLSLCIKGALTLPEDKWPLPIPAPPVVPQAKVLCQILFAILIQLCHEKQIAVGLVGSPNDIRDWLAYRLYQTLPTPPKLASGWRAEFVGTVFEEALAGRISLRIGNPLEEFPLILVREDTPIANSEPAQPG